MGRDRSPPGRGGSRTREVSPRHEPKCPGLCVPELDQEGRRGAAQGLCLEARRSERRVAWKHVGKGNGAYERVDSFKSVADGSGDHAQETPRTMSGCAVFCCSVAVGALLTVWLVYAQGCKVLPRELQPPWADFLGQAAKELQNLQPHKTAADSHDCKDGKTSWQTVWSREKKDWCCRFHGEGCPPDNHYDCKEDLTTWEQKWTEGKKDFCCGYDHKGCRAMEKQQAATTPPPKPKPTPKPKPAEENCEQDLDEWQRKWSEGKRKYCCEKFQFGCTQTTTRVPHDCERDLAKWSTAWSAEKKAWCCKHERVGCPTTPTTTTKPPGGGCDTMCAVKGEVYPCKERIQWLVQQPAPTGFRGSAHACEQSLGTVLRDCPVCAGCTVAHADCNSTKPPEEHHDCNRDLDVWQTMWTPQKKDWCCRTQHIACRPTPAGKYPCMGDVLLWSEAEVAWCCDNRNLGCDA